MELTHRACNCVLRRLFRASCTQRRQIITSRNSYNKRSHYAALGITPQATQADVKAAYYKLTKLYHPDKMGTKSVGAAEAEEHIQKFREVTAAYEVLGNVKLRRLYDKGMYHDGSRGGYTSSTDQTPVEDDDPSLRFYKSREIKSRPPPPTSNTPLYDFDEWSKQHYGATFAKDQSIQNKRNLRMQATASNTNDIKIERVLFAVGVMLITIMILGADITNHDQVVYERKAATEPAAGR